MIKKRDGLKIGFLFFMCSNAVAAEIRSGGESGSVMLQIGSEEVVFKNIVGSSYNVDRSLIDINGSPALLVLSRDSSYFTLLINGREVLVDCAYLI